MNNCAADKEGQEMRSMQRVLLMIHRQAKHDFFAVFNTVIREALWAKGVEVEEVDLSEPPENWKHVAVRMMRHHYDAALVLNSWGEQNLVLDNGESLFDRADLPFFHWIVDHPAEHLGHLRTHCKNYHCICIDRDHVTFLQKYYPDVKNTFFLPLPVSNEMGKKWEYGQFKQRELEVVFAGNCPDIGHMRDVFEHCPEEQRELLFFLADYLLEHPTLSYEDALERILYAVFEREVNPEEMQEYIRLTASVIPYIRARVREEIIRKIMASDVRLHLYGSGWDRYREELKNGCTVMHGAASFSELPGIYSNTKIVLNIMPWFRNGIHDRIATGIYAGAAVATDHSVYLDELAGNYKEDSLLFYDIDKTEEIPGILNHALRNPERLYGMTGYGCKLAEESLSSERIAEELIRIMGNVIAG